MKVGVGKDASSLDAAELAGVEVRVEEDDWLPSDEELLWTDDEDPTPDEYDDENDEEDWTTGREDCGAIASGFAYRPSM